jgi:virginiamycin A acetyltransferase
MEGISTYPFAVFDPEALEAYKAGFSDLPDTVIGPDCWIGHGALILPGARLGAGVIVGAGAVVGGDVAPYSIVTGNPARVLRRRFPEGQVARLLEAAWWTWDTDRIESHIDIIVSGDVDALLRAAPAAA